MREDGCRSFHHDRLVHIVDADPAICEALSAVLRLEGFQTLFSIDTAGFFASLERRCPDVVIVNLRIGREDGIAVLRHLRIMHRRMAVLALEDTAHVERAVLAMKAGAADVVTKPIDADRLLRAVRDALHEETGFVAANSRRRAVGMRGFSQLTSREREVLLLIAQGQSNKEAGRELGISPRTIEVHRARVMEKLGARNAADLMRIVLTG